MNFEQFLQDNNGQSSSTRLVFFLWAIVVLMVWAYLSLKNAELKGLPNEVVTVLAALMAGKTVQRFAEKP